MSLRERFGLTEKNVPMMLLGCLIFNVIDAISTWVLFSKGYITEQNPLMEAAIHAGPIPFFTIKMLLVLLGLSVLWLTKNRKLSIYGAAILFYGYFLLVCWHIFGIAFIL